MQILSTNQCMLRRSAPTTSSRRRSVSVRCATSDLKESLVSRRDALRGAAAMALCPVLIGSAPAVAEEAKFKYRLQPVDSLGAFQKADMRNAFKQRVESTIKQFLDGSDAPACVRLAMLDAGSYDLASKKGGMSGAVILSGASLPAYLKPTVEKLKKAKAAIDSDDKDGAGQISWADMIYLSGKVTSQIAWRESKGAAGQQAGDPWSNPWDGVVLGRMDSDTLGPNKVPALDAPVDEIKAFLLALGAPPGAGGFLSAKAPFWEKPGFLVWTSGSSDVAAEETRLAAADSGFAMAKEDYDRSRRSLAHSEYELDFIKAYNKLCNLGAKFNENAYLFPLKVMDIKL